MTRVSAKPDSDALSGQSGHLLVVDDSRSVRAALRAGLESAGHRVEEMEGGKQALQRIYAGGLDLVVLDVVMPGMDGLAVLRVVRRTSSALDLPIIMATSRHESGEIAEALGAGANDYVTKPIDLLVLKARVENQLVHKRAAAYLRRAQEKLDQRVRQRTRELRDANQRLRTEIEERMRTEDRLRKLVYAVEQSPVSIILTDPNGDIEYANPTACEMSGYVVDELVGTRARILIPESLTGARREEILQSLVDGSGWRGEWSSQRKNGDRYWERVAVSPIRDRSGQTGQFLLVSEDITHYKEYEAQLQRQANFDSLTQLPNRTLAADRLRQALRQAARAGQCVVVLFVDLDQFKDVNDTLGHAAGDQLLIQAAQRLTACVRQEDTVSRLGGDEFLVIMVDDPTEPRAEVVASRILDSFRASFELDTHQVMVGASLGLTCSTQDGDDADDLLRKADTAMYQAKSDGRNTFRFFSPDMTERAVRRLALEYQLRGALDRGELELYFQPIVETATGNVTLVEALLRWKNDKLGFVPPDHFIPVAESSGLIVPIGAWVVETACRHLKTFRERGWSELRVAINVSSRQLRSDGGFSAIVDNALEKSGLSMEALELEITERLLLDGNTDNVSELSELRGRGVRLSIDDFGTGYSALSYLRDYRFDSLKIDRSFVKNALTADRHASLVAGIVSLAHRLGLSVVAEGVEDGEMLNAMRDAQCDLIQGYHFTRPLPAERFIEYLQTQA